MDRALTALRGDETNPTLSPDGKIAYFSWARDGKERDVCRIRVREQVPTCLTSHPAGDTEAKCSPDGNTIAFIRDGEGGKNSLMLIPASGGAEVTIGEGYFNSLAWSRNGKMLVASDADGPGIAHNLRVLKLAGRTWREVTKPSESTLGDVYPSFSPDGNQLTFVRFVNRAKTQVLAVSIDEELRPLSSPRVLVELSGDIRHPVWTDDGGSVLFLFGAPSDHSLWRVSSRGEGTPQRIPEAGANLNHLAIAGRTLVMTREFSDSDIWRANMATPAGVVDKMTRLGGSTQVDEGCMSAWRTSLGHSSYPSVLALDFAFVSATRLDPRIHLYPLKLPEPAHAVRRHAFLGNPCIDGVLADTEVFSNLFNRQPAVCHGGVFHWGI